MSKKNSIIMTTPAEDAQERIPETITRAQFEAWLDGCASEIVAGGCLASDPESKAWNDATFRAQRIIMSYKEGRGLFQLATNEGESA